VVEISLGPRDPLEHDEEGEVAEEGAQEQDLRNELVPGVPHSRSKEQYNSTTGRELRGRGRRVVRNQNLALRNLASLAEAQSQQKTAKAYNTTTQHHAYKH